MNNGENRTKQIVTVLSRMTGRLNLTKNSKKAALETKAEEQRKAQKEAEIKYNEETSERIAGKGSERTQEELAEKAWGSRSWKEMRYRERMAELYSKYTGIEYANSRRLTETYMDDTIESMLNEYSEKLEKEQEKLVEVKVRENAIQEENIETQTAQTESQIKQILAVAESEWEKAEKTLSAAYRKWKERFHAEVKGKREKWEKNYVEFLSEKTKWINRQYMNAAVGGNMELLKNSGTDIEKVLSNAAAALEAEEKEKNSSGKTEALVKETMDGLFEGGNPVKAGGNGRDDGHNGKKHRKERKQEKTAEPCRSGKLYKRNKNAGENGSGDKNGSGEAGGGTGGEVNGADDKIIHGQNRSGKRKHKGMAGRDGTQRRV